MRKEKFLFYTSFIILFSNNIYASSLSVIEQIEKNLIYKNDVQRAPKNDVLTINRGGWSEDASKKIEDSFNTTDDTAEKKIQTEITRQKNDERQITLSRKAYDASTIGQIEVAIEYYKRILKADKTNNYALLALATSYHQLGQFRQAKPLYLRLLEVFPAEEQIMVNLLSIVTEETPYEAVYLLSSMADKNPNSPLLQAQTSIAYSNIGEYDKAITYLEKAIVLDQRNVQYMYNLAVLHDLMEDYKTAYSIYNDLIIYAQQNDEVSKIPYKTVVERVKLLQEYI